MSFVKSAFLQLIVNASYVLTFAATSIGSSFQSRRMFCILPVCLPWKGRMIGPCCQVEIHSPMCATDVKTNITQQIHKLSAQMLFILTHKHLPHPVVLAWPVFPNE